MLRWVLWAWWILTIISNESMDFNGPKEFYDADKEIIITNSQCGWQRDIIHRPTSCHLALVGPPSLLGQIFVTKKLTEVNQMCIFLGSSKDCKTTGTVICIISNKGMALSTCFCCPVSESIKVNMQQLDHHQDSITQILILFVRQMKSQSLKIVNISSTVMGVRNQTKQIIIEF